MCVLGLQTLRNLLEATLHSDLEDASLIHQAWVAATGHTAEQCRYTGLGCTQMCVQRLGTHAAKEWIRKPRKLLRESTAISFHRFQHHKSLAFHTKDL